jgi:hypothetical protein
LILPFFSHPRAGNKLLCSSAAASVWFPVLLFFLGAARITTCQNRKSR